jgi:mRNA interferase HigB
VRIIKRSTLAKFWGTHPETKSSLQRWHTIFKTAEFGSMDDIAKAVPKAKILNGERARFEVAGGNFRMIVAFEFAHQVAWIKFLGTHAEYDAVDALTVAMF